MEDDFVCLINVEGGTSPSTTQTLLCNENEKSSVVVNMIVTVAAATVDEELVALIIIIFQMLSLNLLLSLFFLFSVVDGRGEAAGEIVDGSGTDGRRSATLNFP